MHVNEIPKILFKEFVEKLSKEGKMDGVRKINKYEIRELNNRIGAIVYYEEVDTPCYTVFTILSLSEDFYYCYNAFDRRSGEHLFINRIRDEPLAEFKAGPIALVSGGLTAHVQENLKIYFPKYKGLLPEDPMTPILVSVLARAAELVSLADCEKPKYFSKDFQISWHY